MAETDVSICARALVLLGARPINALTETTDNARICALVYPNLKNSIMSRYGWRFLMTKKQLTRDATAPIGEWSYSYLIPGDALSVPHAVFWSSGTKLTNNRFEIFGRRLYSDDAEIWMDYIVARPESEWPAWFVDLITKALCAEIAFSVTDQQSVAENWNYKAYGTPSESGQGGAMGEAMIIDSQGNGNIGFYDTAFIEARFGGWY